MKILAIVAHPDDEVLGIGGTLLRHLELGDKVSVAIAGQCRPLGQAEAFRVADMMGTALTFGPFDPLGIAQDPRAVTAYVEECVKRVDPDTVYTHHRGDAHADHRVLHDAVAVACRPYASSVKYLGAFYTPSSSEWGPEPFVPDRFHDITAFMELKLAAMSLYRSEMRDTPHPRSRASLLATAGHFGSQVGVRFAEPLRTIRSVW